jgi:hypothetical protein
MISRTLSFAWVMLLAVAPLVARADDYSDFRIPAHHVLRWDGSLQPSGRRVADDIETGAGTTAIKDRAVQGLGSSTFSWLSDSDLRTTQVVGTLFGGLDESWFSNDFTTSTLTQGESDGDRSAREGWQVFLSHRSYPWAVPLGFSVSLFAQGRYGQDWMHSDQTVNDFIFSNSNLVHDDTEQWTYFTAVDDAASVGWGRVRDATGVYDAEVLERRLLEAGALARPLSAGARHRLAEFFYLRDDYESLPQRPAKSMWERIEDLPATRAVADSGLDARDPARRRIRVVRRTVP